VLNKAAAVKIGSSLIGRKLMREIRSKPGMPVWRADEDGPSMSLVITRAGRDAIGIIKPGIDPMVVAKGDKVRIRMGRRAAFLR
jgi:hypothetical protein